MVKSGKSLSFKHLTKICNVDFSIRDSRDELVRIRNVIRSRDPALYREFKDRLQAEIDKLNGMFGKGSVCDDMLNRKLGMK